MATDIDLHLGKYLRLRRKFLGLTQHQLAQAIGVRFQQIQKYECGANRISAARLFELAQALETPVTYFYDGLIDGKPAAALAQNKNAEIFSRKESADILQAYFSLGTKLRRQLLELAKSMSDNLQPVGHAVGTVVSEVFERVAKPAAPGQINNAVSAPAPGLGTAKTA